MRSPAEGAVGCRLSTDFSCCMLHRADGRHEVRCPRGAELRRDAPIGVRVPASNVLEVQGHCCQSLARSGLRRGRSFSQHRGDGAGGPASAGPLRVVVTSTAIVTMAGSPSGYRQGRGDGRGISRLHTELLLLIPRGGVWQAGTGTESVQFTRSERVGRRGLEPLTPCASCKCATSCANGPFPEPYHRAIRRPHWGGLRRAVSVRRVRT